MHTRTKSALLLLAVLALGIVIGALLNGALVNRRMDRIARMRTGPGIAFIIEEAVKPESVEQRDSIRAVLQAAGPRFAEIFERSREEMDALSDSVMRELSSVLSDDQMRALRRHMDLRWQRARRGHGLQRERRRTPPPGRPLPDGSPPGPPVEQP